MTGFSSPPLGIRSKTRGPVAELGLASSHFHFWASRSPLVCIRLRARSL